MTCEHCKVPTPRGGAACPFCGYSLLSPELGEPTDDSLAPTIYKGQRVKPGDDLAKILREAPVGAQIELDAGTFILPQLVTLPHGITLNGAGSDHTRVVGRGEPCVLRVQGKAGRFVANGLSFEHQGSQGCYDLLVVEDGEVDIQGCRFRGARLRLADASGAKGRGLVLRGESRGTIRRCEFLDNDGTGVELGDRSSVLVRGCLARGNRGAGFSVGGEARPSLQENRALVNFQAGIVFHERAGGRANENTCSQNGTLGIAVFQAAEPELTENILRANNSGGLAFWNDARGSASRNVIEENRRLGIEVLDGAAPTLVQNEVRRNRGYGLFFGGKARGLALQNRCEENRDKDVELRDEARPVLGGNKEDRP